MSRANTDPVIVRSAAPDDRRAIERLLRDLPGVWQSSWRKDVVARALGASDDLAFVAVRDRGPRDRRLLVSPVRTPWSHSAWRTHFRKVSAEQPLFAAVDSIAAHCEA